MTFLWIFFCVFIYFGHTNSETFQIVNQCPLNYLEWQRKAREKECTKTIPYHCMQLRNGKLAELCMGTVALNPKNGCPLLDIGMFSFEVKSYFMCSKSRGCPVIGDQLYPSDELYIYPACIKGSKVGHGLPTNYIYDPNSRYVAVATVLPSQRLANEKNASNHRDRREDSSNNYELREQIQTDMPDAIKKNTTVFYVALSVCGGLIMFLMVVILVWIIKGRKRDQIVIDNVKMDLDESGVETAKQTSSPNIESQTKQEQNWSNVYDEILSIHSTENFNETMQDSPDVNPSWCSSQCVNGNTDPSNLQPYVNVNNKESVLDSYDEPDVQRYEKLDVGNDTGKNIYTKVVENVQPDDIAEPKSLKMTTEYQNEHGISK